MSLFTSILFLFFSILFTNQDGHKFYVSTTNLVYKKEEASIQITTQLFIDDIEHLLQIENPNLRLYPDSDAKKIDIVLEKVLKKNLKIQIDQNWINYTYLGKEYKNDILQCYIEVKEIKSPKIITVQNTIFFNLFEDQQNIIHFKNDDLRKSFLLHIKKNLVRFSFD